MSAHHQHSRLDHLLLVEDDPVDEALIRSVLQGAVSIERLSAVGSLAEARKILGEGAPDLILLDLGLPDSSGEDTIQAVRAGAPETPVVVLTGDARPDTFSRAIRGAADGFLTKGEVDPVFLAREMRYACERRVATLELEARDRLIQENEARLRSVLGTVSDGVLVLRKDGTVAFANREAASLLDPESSEELRPSLLELAGSEEERAMRLRHAGRELEAEGRHIQWEGEAATVVCVRDVTERMRTERHDRSIARVQAVSTLAAGLAHSVNNILMVIRANAQLLERLPEGPVGGASKLAREVDGAAAEAGRLMREILAVGRDRRLKVESVDLGRTLSRVVEAAPPHAQPHVGRSMVPVAVRADQHALEEIIQNLLENAWEATTAGGDVGVEYERVTVDESHPRRASGLRPGSYGRFVVHDSGTGMSAQLLERAFDPFVTTKPRESGAGLGLATVYGLTKQLGGYVYLTSVQGQGTSVEVFLPEFRVEERMHGSAVSGPGGASPAGSEPDAGLVLLEGVSKVLVVDDDEEVRGSSARLLERMGYSVHTVENGEAALEYLDQDDSVVHMVISDVVMPGMGGVGLYRAVLDRPDPLPMVLTSGYAPDDPASPVGPLPEASILAKPWAIEDLLRAMGDAMLRHAGSRPGVAP